MRKRFTKSDFTIGGGKAHALYTGRKVAPDEVLDLMECENISRMHVGKDTYPYRYYKTILSILKKGGNPFIDSSALRIIQLYCTMSRKQRREIPRSSHFFNVAKNLLTYKNKI
jgi:hypothetical protein